MSTDSSIMISENETKTHQGPQGKSIQAVRGLIARRIPQYQSYFDFSFIPAENGKDVLEIEMSGTKILLKASSTSGLTSALNWYLKYYCNAHISWCGNQLNLPVAPPGVPEKVRLVSPYAYRYYLNYCTFSYSMAWWDWPRWEQEIDWMALNGINMPLAVTGHEIIWQKVLRELDIPDEEIYQIFAGSAYRAWGWMGNLANWGGPLNQSWMDDQMELQKNILRREREFGMKPVLQGFSGHVPQRLKKYFPNAHIYPLPDWYGYDGNYFLDPDDALFDVLIEKFMFHQQQLYGSDHLYAADIFHEIEAPSDHQNDLSRISKSILNAMQKIDSQAIWVMQSWSLRESILTELPFEHVLVLDLYCDSEPKWSKTNAFSGKPWIWCMLHNFGGRTGMSGKFHDIPQDLLAALNDPNRGELTGIGIAPEGIEHNPVMYDLMMEMAWRSKPFVIDEWLRRYVIRRYGRELEPVVEAWKILADTVYTGPASYGPLESEICARPALHIEKVSSNGSTRLYYDPAKLMMVWKLMLQAADALKPEETYRYDLVDIGRQILTNFAKFIHADVTEAYKNGDQSRFRTASELFLNLIVDLDRLLATERLFLFGRWLNDARRKGKNESDKRLLEWNANTQVTLWSASDVPEFHDYANKQWSGLLISYYYERWKMFFRALETGMAGREGFDSVKFKAELICWEMNWANMDHQFPETTQGDGLMISRELFARYSAMMDKYFSAAERNSQKHPELNTNGSHKEIAGEIVSH